MSLPFWVIPFLSHSLSVSFTSYIHYFPVSFSICIHFEQKSFTTGILHYLNPPSPATKPSFLHHPPCKRETELHLSTQLQCQARKKAKSDQSAPAPDTMDTTGDSPARLRQTSFEHLYRPKPLRCAVQIDDNLIIGNPFESTSQGYDIKVALDPGRYGQPSVGLNWIIKKADADIEGKDTNHSFALGWEAGVKIGGQWMMDKLFSFPAHVPGRRLKLQHLRVVPVPLHHIRVVAHMLYGTTGGCGEGTHPAILPVYG